MLGRMQQQMEIKLAEVWAERAPNLPFSSANELAILASIIEKETGLDEERDLVASVFINRLRKICRFSLTRQWPTACLMQMV